MKNPFSKFMVQEKHKITRQFSYAKGEVRLDFSLRLDIKHQLKDFKECIVKALQDIDKELTKFK